jgi:hypothetical protein
VAQGEWAFQKEEEEEEKEEIILKLTFLILKFCKSQIYLFLKQFLTKEIKSGELKV